LEQRREQLKLQLAAIDQQLEQAADRQQAQEHAADINARLTMNEADNQTALTISEAEIEAGGNSSLTTGTGIGGGN
jgi:hypothetical protein